MRKHRLKIYLKLGILLFGISLILYACQKDETIPTDEDFAKTELIDFANLKLNNTSLDDLVSQLNGIDFTNSTLSRVDFGLNQNLNLRTTDTLLTVDTDDVFFAQYEDSNFTTFKIIETPEDGSFRNLIIENIDTNNPIAKILTYFPDEDWVDADQSITEYAGDVTIEDFMGVWQSNARSQYCFIATTPTWGCAWHPNSGHEPGYPGCNGGNFINGYSTTEDCYDFAGGEGSGGGSGEGSGGGSGDGSTGGNDLPIDGPIITKPVLSEEELGRRRECNKIKDMVNAEDQAYMNKVKDLKNKADLPYETTVTLSVDETINEYQGADNTTLVDVPLNPPSKYTAVSHVHVQNDSIKPTYSVPSLGDLVWIAESLDDNGIRAGKFVAFLTTADGTYLALTLKNSEKLRSYFNYRNAYRDDITSEQRMQYFSELTQEKSDLMWTYYNDPNNALIKESNQTNIASLRYFMEFLEQTDLGVEVFKTNENFDSFQQVKLNDSGSVVYEEPCELN